MIEVSNQTDTIVIQTNSIFKSRTNMSNDFERKVKGLFVYAKLEPVLYIYYCETIISLCNYDPNFFS